MEIAIVIIIAVLVLILMQGVGQGYRTKRIEDMVTDLHDAARAKAEEAEQVG